MAYLETKCISFKRKTNFIFKLLVSLVCVHVDFMPLFSCNVEQYFVCMSLLYLFLFNDSIVLIYGGYFLLNLCLWYMAGDVVVLCLGSGYDDNL